MVDSPPPPSQKQASEAQQARYAAETAILPLFKAAETGEGSGDDDASVLHGLTIMAVLASLSAAIVFTSFRDPHDRSKSLLEEKPDDSEISEQVLADAQRMFNRLLSSDLTDEQKAVFWATWAYSRTADEIADLVRSGKLPHQFSDQKVHLNKVWISRSDARVRSLHAKLHGKTVLTSDDFWRWPETDERLRWPGDSEAPPGATIGCRCVCLLTWAGQSSVSETIRKITERTAP